MLLALARQHTGTSTASSSNQARFSRLPHNELLDLLISQFSIAPYWSLKSLNEHVKQPQTYLRQTLTEIANLVKNGPYAGTWALKAEFKRGSTQQSGGAEPSTPRIKEEGRVVGEGQDGGEGEGQPRVKAEEGDDPEDDPDSAASDDEEDGMEFVS